LRGKKITVEDTNANWNSTGGCPFVAASEKLKKVLPAE
jgi:hypothetical protein